MPASTEKESDMKQKRTSVHLSKASALAVLLAAICMVAASLNAVAAPKLIIAGDSSTSDHDASKMPHRSWARQLEKYMKPGVTIDNYARGGASTKSFLASGQWRKLVAAIRPGDYVLIQFGGNDQKRSTPFYLEKRFADPNGLYREIIRGFVDDEPSKDTTHTVDAGAEAWAKAFVEDVKKRNLDVATIFR